MGTIGTFVRRGRAWVAGRLHREKPHRPTWSDSDLRDAVLTYRARHRWPDLAASDPSGSAGRWWVRHFRERTQPAFFAPLAQIQELAQGNPFRSLREPECHGVPYLDCNALTAAQDGWRDLPAGPGDDVLYKVRPHRFAAAPRLALRALDEPEARQQLKETLDGWMRLAASGRSMLPYLSNLVVVQRLLALSWAWAFLAARRPADGRPETLELEADVLKIIRADCAYLLPRIGDSFPNNHLLADRFAHWYIARLFPEFVPLGSRPLADLDREFRDELSRQVLDDGTGFEHSTHYHEFACEMTLAHTLLTRANADEDDAAAPWSQAMLERMLRFQIDLAGPTGRAPAYGNGTEDPLFPLDAGDGWATAAFRECYRALFDPDFASPSSLEPSAERAYWLLGGKLVGTTAGALRTSALAAYPKGGFFVFAEDDATTRLVFRTGPASGERAMAGHMHADLLSVTAVDQGMPCLVDSGTWTYRLGARDPLHGADGWRSYFGGPSAHNGPGLTGVDPLGPLTDDFRPREPRTTASTTALHSSRSLSWVEAALAGDAAYEGLRRGVVHVAGGYWLIYDAVPATRAPTGLAYRFQLAPGWEVKPDPVTRQTSLHTPGRVAAALCWCDGLALSHVLEGCLEPRGGWVSPTYGELRAAPQLVFEPCEGQSGPVTAYVLAHGGAPRGALEVQCRSVEQGFAFRIESPKVTDYVFVVHELTPKGIEAWGIQFDGRVLWLRLSHEGHLLAMRWVSGRSVRLLSTRWSAEAERTLDDLDIPREVLAASHTSDRWPQGLRVDWPLAAEIGTGRNEHIINGACS